MALARTATQTATDVARRYAVDAHAADGQFHSQPARKPDHADLRRRILDMLVQTIGDTHNRGEGDHAAFFSLSHSGGDGPTDPHNTLEVNVVGVIPAFATTASGGPYRSRTAATTESTSEASVTSR